MFILEVRVECFVKGKWRFAFDCRSLQIRWFLSDCTVLAVRRQSPCVLVMTSLDDRMASAGWQVGGGEIGYVTQECLDVPADCVAGQSPVCSPP